MTTYYDFARQILLGESLEDKLIDAPFEWSSWSEFDLPSTPGRIGKISFSQNRIKFPRKENLNLDDKKAVALHSFANHELLAIEMMAAALLVYPHHDEDGIRFKRGILTALKDEQKHLLLYIGRLNELGYEFGDFPLNDFFWKQMPKLKTPSQYVAIMSLTFEAANLDFAQYYSQIFRGYGDEKTASILETVLEDEISHVQFGVHWLKKWREDKTLWEYYRDCLPFPLTPARGKGLGFDSSLHMKAVGDQEFIHNLAKYEDDFLVTKRKS
jgi:uncharacterized ferritin-like protein (DUF455 family)